MAVGGGRAAAGKQFRMQGLSRLQRSLDQLPNRLRETALKNASAAGARVIRNEAKQRVPVETGQLRKNIVVARTIKQKGRKRRIRGAVFVGIRGAARYYAHLVEFGTSKLSARPFLRPALDQKAPEALRAIAEKLAKEIDKQARRLTGWKSAKQIKRLTR